MQKVFKEKKKHQTTEERLKHIVSRDEYVKGVTIKIPRMVVPDGYFRDRKEMYQAFDKYLDEVSKVIGKQRGPEFQLFLTGFITAFDIVSQYREGPTILK